MPTRTFFNLPQDKQDRVLTAAVNEFSQRNVEEANLSNIVRQAGIPRGSLYQYFTDKDDLYVYMFETLREERWVHTKEAFEYYKTSEFLTFFEHYYLLDTLYLLQHPQHIELGKVMYSHARGVSFGLIDAIQRRYRDIFLVGIDYDQDNGRIRADVDSQALADLCVHFMTDVFIFQNITRRMSLAGVEKHLQGTMDLIRRGVQP
ncbi:MAG: TetR/AcrR family transcriptional regulator [Propionibacteriaceae bacterium]|nr:TetR/AcrR family transcriptional regulator [Propionibacteriaceae bacterium]